MPRWLLRQKTEARVAQLERAQRARPADLRDRILRRRMTRRQRQSGNAKPPGIGNSRATVPRGREVAPVRCRRMPPAHRRASSSIVRRA